MQQVTPAEYNALLRRDFCAFAQRCFYELNAQAPFRWNWHIEVMATKLTACFGRKIRRLIINIPPRHLKSLCASIALPAWWLGHDPAAQIVCVSYGQELSDKHARDCRTIMTSAFYQRAFPTRLSPEKQAVQEFVTTKQGFRFATSVGGVVTGRGGDVVIIDDPLKPDEALSDVRRKTVNEWYDHSLFSRLNDKRTGCIILIMQRLHEDDLVGHVLEQEHWEVVSFPAIAEQDQEIRFETLSGPRLVVRQAGDVLHPEREPRETLDRIRRTIGEYNFAGQYQQAPAPLGGGLVRADWFQRYESGDLPERFDQILQSWDTANKASEFGDFSVCTTWGIWNRRLYLLDVLRKRMNYPDLKRAVRDQWLKHRPTVVLIEDKASGTQLIQELVAEGVHSVTRYKPDGDKLMRFHAQTATIENGLVYLPQNAHWLGEYLHELITFPGSKYDDQVDSTSQALAWTKQGSGAEAWIEWARQQADVAWGARPGHAQAKPDNDTEDRWVSEIYERIVSARSKRAEPVCAWCGEEMGKSYIKDGVDVYHHDFDKDCYALMMKHSTKPLGG